MGMNVYVKLTDLKAAMQFIDVQISSSSTELEGEHLMEINVSVSHRSTLWECVGELQVGTNCVVCFDRSSRDLIIQICTQVGIPFSFTNS
jgi:hypothetical protein